MCDGGLIEVKDILLDFGEVLSEQRTDLKGEPTRIKN